MADRHCRQCGLALPGSSEHACPRCGASLAAGALVPLFDQASGAPLAPARLRCWHCGQPIAQVAMACSNCGVYLLDRSSAAVAYDVVPRTDAASVPEPTSAPGVFCFHCGFAAKQGATGCLRCGVAFDDLNAAVCFDRNTGRDLGGPVRMSAPSAGAAPPNWRRWNFIAAHWHGAFSLGVSFWVFGILFNVAFGYFSPYIIDVLPAPTAPIGVFAWVIGVWLAGLAIAVWQFLGISRSARRRRRERRFGGRGAFWAIVVQIWVVLWVFAYAQVISTVGAEQFRIGYEVAFLGDPEIPDFTVTTNRANGTITVEGGVKFGLAEAIETALAESPGTTTVILRGPGGRIGPAKTAYDLIRERGLSTHVNGVCLSACTLIFAAGETRTVGPAAVLGYHTSSSGYRLDYEDPDDGYYRDLMLEAGLARDFVAEVLNIPPWDMWYPNYDRLLRAGAVTGRDSSIR